MKARSNAMCTVTGALAIALAAGIGLAAFAQSVKSNAPTDDLKRQLQTTNESIGFATTDSIGSAKNDVQKQNWIPTGGGECAGNCGGQAPSGCWCDNSCAGFGDCCAGVCDDCPELTHCDSGNPAECPKGGILENEPDCGDYLSNPPNDTVNGGCNSSPPIFSPINCGDTICGSSAQGASFRDTDWYEIETTQDTIFTWTATATFPAVIGYIPTVPLGGGDCSTITVLDPFATGGTGTPISITTTCLPPGKHWFFISTNTGGTVPCPSDYVATLTCESCGGPQKCVGDLNDDGVVNAGDLILLVTYWGKCPVAGLPGSCVGSCGTQSPDGCWCDETCCSFGDCCQDKTATCGGCSLPPVDCPGDLNGDGRVDMLDILILLGDWGCISGTNQECGDAETGDCCVANGTAYCNDAECCNAVCALDPYCCDVEWDTLCANLANDICAVCEVGSDCPAGGDGDECQTPLLITDGFVMGFLGDNTGSTGDDTSCAFNDTIDEWYCYIATCTGTATASTCNPGTEFDTVLAAFSDCGGVELACNDDAVGAPPECALNGLNRKSRISWSVTAGTRYYIRVSAFNNAVGSGVYELSVSCSGN